MRKRFHGCEDEHGVIANILTCFELENEHKHKVRCVLESVERIYKARIHLQNTES
jgi:hypothetical protein